MTIKATDSILPSYRYKAEVVKITDGDGLVCNVDLGFSIWIKNHPLRLAGCNAPELEPKEPLKKWAIDGPEYVAWLNSPGFKAREALFKFIFNCAVSEEPVPVVIETEKNQSDKYGRLLAYVWVQRKCDICSGSGMLKPDPKHAKIDCPNCVKGLRWLRVNDMMLDGGFCKPWDGQGSKPV